MYDLRFYILLISAWEQVAKTQQETVLITAALPHIQLMSTGPQEPRLLPKQVCYRVLSQGSSIVLLITYGALGNLVKKTLSHDGGAERCNHGDDGEAHRDRFGMLRFRKSESVLGDDDRTKARGDNRFLNQPNYWRAPRCMKAWVLGA